MPEKAIDRPPLDAVEADLLGKVDDKKEDLVRLLEQLVAIDSRTRDLDTHADLLPAMTFVKEWMEPAGATSKIYHCPHPGDEKGRTWPSLVCTVGDPGATPCLQFCGHLDVVPFTEEAWEPGLHPLKAVVKDGRMYGRGTADMKGGVAAQMMAARILAGSGLPLQGRLQLLCVPDEEINGDYGAQFMADHHKADINADMTVIAEPTGQPPIKSPAIILGEKGHAWTVLTFRGASGHGSMPKPVSNAINKATRFISLAPKAWKLPKVQPPLSLATMLKGLLSRFSLGSLIKMLREPADATRDPRDEDGLGVGNFFKTTVSFTGIKAGTKINVIPDACEVQLDIRVLPGVQVQEVIDSMARYCSVLGYRLQVPDGYANLQADDAKLQARPVDVEMRFVSCTPGTYVQPNEKTGMLSRAFEDVYKVRAVYFFAPGSTDAVHLRGRGIENVVVFGPTGGNTHDANEFVEVDELVKTCKVYLLHAYRMLCKAGGA